LNLAQETEARVHPEQYGGFFCDFLSAIGALFSGADIDAAFVSSVQTLEFP